MGSSRDRQALHQRGRLRHVFVLGQGARPSTQQSHKFWWPCDVIRRHFRFQVREGACDISRHRPMLPPGRWHRNGRGWSERCSTALEPYIKIEGYQVGCVSWRKRLRRRVNLAAGARVRTRLITRIDLCMPPKKPFRSAEVIL